MDKPQSYLYIYGEKVKVGDWRKSGKSLFTKYFRGWDSQLENISRQDREDVDGIDDYFRKTLEPVVADLCENLYKSPEHGWDLWVEKWSTLSIEDFLRSDKCQDKTGMQYCPWPQAAVEGFKVTNYFYHLERSCVEFFRCTFGDWWPTLMEAPKYGMSIIPEKFIASTRIGKTNVNLSARIEYGIKVLNIEKTKGNRVKVGARNIITGHQSSFEADAVIVTVPLTVLRQIDISVEGYDMKYQRAVANVHYIAFTKIMLQCRTRFWEKDIGNGGLTKTSLPIGTFCYMKNNSKTKRGVLLVHCAGQDALVFGAQKEEEAIDSAIRQIAKRHPELITEFEFGKVKAWFSDSSEQGGVTQFLPYQYSTAIKTLMTPIHPLYLAGEAISYSHGWIQGAMESGMDAAYHLYCYDIGRD